MMKRVYFLFLGLIFCGGLAAQETVNVDCVVVVDGVALYVGDFRILFTNESGKPDSIRAWYHPGNLSFDKDDYEKILLSSSVVLKISHSPYDKKGRRKGYSYEIKVDKHFFEDSFFVIQIYNQDKRRYRRFFDFSERSYVYDIFLDESVRIMTFRKKGKVLIPI